MPPITTLQHLAGLQHAQRIHVAEHRARLFRQPLAARAGTSATIIAMPAPRHLAASSACVA